MPRELETRILWRAYPEQKPPMNGVYEVLFSDSIRGSSFWDGREWGSKNVTHFALESDSATTSPREDGSGTARKWTPQAIGQAPEGRYRSRYAKEWKNNGDRPLYDILNEIANAEARAKDGKPPVLGLPDEYFGPIPQPEDR